MNKFDLSKYDPALKNKESEKIMEPPGWFSGGPGAFNLKEKLLPQKPKEVQKPKSKFDLSKYDPALQKPAEKKEDSVETLMRYMMQGHAAGATIATSPVSLLELMLKSPGGESDNHEQMKKNWEQRKKTNPDLPDFDEVEKGFEEVGAKFRSYLPTFANYEKSIEKSTGLPLEAKTKGQKALRLGLESAAMQPGSLLARGVSAISSPIISEALQAAGISEETANLIASTAPLAINKAGRATTDWIKGMTSGSKTSALKGEKLGGDFKSKSEAFKAGIDDFGSGSPPPPPGGPGSPPPPPPPPPGSREFPLPKSPEGKAPIKFKATPGGKDLGLRPASATPKDIGEEIGNNISGNRFYNTTTGGLKIKDRIIKADEAVYKEVKQAYIDAKPLNKNIIEEQPELVEKINARIRDLKQIPSKSSPQTSLLKSLIDIRNKLIVKNKKGKIVGYKPISNQILIEQNQALKGKVDYDFAHGNPNNIFKPFIGEIEEAILLTAQEQNPEAFKALEAAKAKYAKWSDTFNNDYLRPWRDRSNKDFSKSYKGMLDLDEYNQIAPILNATEDGVVLAKAAKRDLVDKYLKEFYKNPSSANKKELETTLRELESVLTPEETKSISKILESPRKRNIKGKYQKPTEKPAPKVNKYKSMTRKQLEAEFSHEETIRQLKNEIKTPQQKKTFDEMMRHKTREILNEGKLTKKSTGTELYNVLNDIENSEILRAGWGDAEFERVLQAAEKIGAQHATEQNFIKFGKVGLTAKALVNLGLF